MYVYIHAYIWYIFVAPNPVNANSMEVLATNDDILVTWQVCQSLSHLQIHVLVVVSQAPEVDVCLMTDISYYETSINTGKLSVDTKKPSATFLLKSLEELELNNTFLITIVVYNSEGMSSQPTSKSFGMNIHNYTTAY